MKATPYNILIIVFTVFSLQKGKTQSSGYGDIKVNANFGLVAGYSGFTNNMIELGIGYQPWDVKGSFVYFPFAGFMALYEFDPNRNFYGTSINAWYLAGFFAAGLNVNRYSDYTNQTFGVKPMIGISFLRIGVMYGYNFYLNDNLIKNFYHHSLTIRYYLPIWKRKD